MPARLARSPHGAASITLAARPSQFCEDCSGDIVVLVVQEARLEGRAMGGGRKGTELYPYPLIDTATRLSEGRQTQPELWR